MKDLVRVDVLLLGISAFRSAVGDFFSTMDVSFPLPRTDLLTVLVFGAEPLRSCGGEFSGTKNSAPSGGEEGWSWLCAREFSFSSTLAISDSIVISDFTLGSSTGG